LGSVKAEDLDVDKGDTLLKWILRNQGVKLWAGLVRLKVGAGSGYGDELSGSIKGGEFLGWPNDY
jgi:hypothetical protein